MGFTYLKDDSKICLLPDFYIGDNFEQLKNLVDKICQDTGADAQSVSFEKVQSSRRYKGIHVVWVNLNKYTHHVEYPKNKVSLELNTPKDCITVNSVFNFLYD